MKTSKVSTKVEELGFVYQSLSNKIVVTGKSVTVFNQVANEKGIAIYSDLVAFSFREKSHWVYPQGADKVIFFRTANRHRWIGRGD